jgi:hypothetical protein
MMRFGLQNEKTRSALAKAGSLALAEFIKRPQAETQIGAIEIIRRSMSLSIGRRRGLVLV